MTRMRATPGIVDVDSAAAVRKPEVRVTVDRQRAADLGLRAADVAASLRTLVGGEPISKIREGSEQYDVWLRLQPSDRNSLDALRALPMQARTGLTRLDAIATLARDRGPADISRLNRVRQVEVNANLDGIPLGTAVEKARALADSELPAGYEAVFGGRAKVMAETMVSFLTALGLSFLFMYMVLAAQFESLLHPVTIMLALPLALPFALLSLLLMATRSTSTPRSACSCCSHRQEERDPAGRHDQPPHPRRDGAQPRHHRGQQDPPPPDPDDNDDAHLRDDPHRARQGPRRGVTRDDGQRDHRRAGHVAAHHAADRSGGVLALRRRRSFLAQAPRTLRQGRARSPSTASEPSPNSAE